MSEKLTTLEGFRGVTATLLVLYHLQDIFASDGAPPPFAGAFAAGDRGVDLFFVLSGFIIAMTHAGEIGKPGRIGSYLYRRGCRLFPSVWIMSAFALALYAADFGGAGKAGKIAVWNVVASFLLLPQDGTPLVNVTWTLKYEVFFYVVFAMMIVSRRLGLWLLLAWQAAIVLELVRLARSDGTSDVGAWATYYLNPIGLEFGIGMLCAWVVTRGPASFTARATRLSPVILAAGVGLCVAAMLYEAAVQRHVLTPLRWLVYGSAAGAIILGLVWLERAGRLRAPPALVALGGASYAIYLVNFSAITLAAVALRRLGVRAPGSAMLVGCAILAIAGGFAFHHLIDRPIQARLRRSAMQERSAARALTTMPQGALQRPCHAGESAS